MSLFSRTASLMAAAAVGGVLTLMAQRLTASSSATAPSAGGGNVLAVVDGETITADEFLTELNRRGGTESYPAPEHRRALLDAMVGDAAMVAAARRAGLEHEPGTAREIHRLLAGQFRERRIDPEVAAVRVSDEDVRAFYDQHPDRYTTPEAAHVAIILFAVAEDAGSEAWQSTAARAEQVRAEAERQDPRGDFGALAAETSADQVSRYRGGDVGWVKRGDQYSRFEPVVLETIAALDQPGALSPVVRGERGMYLVRLLERQPGSVRSFDSVKSGIAQRLLRERRTAREQSLQTELTAGVPIDVDEARFAELEAKLPPVAAQRPLEPPPLPQG